MFFDSTLAAHLNAIEKLLTCHKWSYHIQLFKFRDQSNSQKTIVASKVNNLVTSDAEDADDASDDPYSFLNFTYEGNELGHSKYFSHNEYKWK